MEKGNGVGTKGRYDMYIIHSIVYGIIQGTEKNSISHLKNGSKLNEHNHTGQVLTKSHNNKSEFEVQNWRELYKLSINIFSDVSDILVRTPSARNSRSCSHGDH
jgi:hypothetical protein